MGNDISILGGIADIHMDELRKEQQVRVTADLKMEGFPRMVDLDSETDEEEFAMVITDPEFKLVVIFGAMEKKGGVARKLKESGMKKLRMGVSMPGRSVKLTKKAMAADTGMASQQIQHLMGFKAGTVTYAFTTEVKGGAGSSAAPEVSYPRQCHGP